MKLVRGQPLSLLELGDKLLESRREPTPIPPRTVRRKNRLLHPNRTCFVDLISERRHVLRVCHGLACVDYHLHVPKDSPGRIPTLDGVRAIAIIFVLAAHGLGTRNLPAFRTARALFADVGVRTFFVLSGYLITVLLLRELAKTGRISLRGFYLRRATRIFPAFYVFLGVVTILVTCGYLVVPQLQLWLASVYLSNFQAFRAWPIGHLWSLAVEEHFYLLWPLTLALIGKRRACIGVIAVILASPFIRFIAWHLSTDLQPLIRNASPFVFDALATGCLLALAREVLEKQRLYMAVLAAPWFWIVPMLLVGTLLAPSPIWMPKPAITFANFGIALAIHRGLLYPNARVSQFLETTPMVWIGTISYSLYLWQQLFLDRSQTSWPHAFPVNIVLAFCLAATSHYLVEQPILRWSRARRDH